MNLIRDGLSRNRPRNNLETIKWAGIIFLAGFLFGGFLTLRYLPRPRPSIVLNPTPAQTRQADLAGQIDLRGQLTSEPVKLPPVDKSLGGVLPTSDTPEGDETRNPNSSPPGHPGASFEDKNNGELAASVSGAQPLDAGFYVGEQVTGDLHGSLAATVTDTRTGKTLTSSMADLDGQFTTTFTAPRELQVDVTFGHALNFAVTGAPPPSWTYAVGAGWSLDGPCAWGQVERRLIGDLSLCASGTLAGGEFDLFAGVIYRGGR